MAGRHHAPEVRARVLAEVLAGESIKTVARRWSVPYTTAVGWWREDRPYDTANARTRERMVDEVYDCASAIFQGVRATAELLQDPGWLRTQEATGLAALVATLSDRGLRMLGGLRPLGDDEQRSLDAGRVVDAAAGAPD